MITTSVPNVRNRAWISPRPPWQTAAARAVWRAVDSTGTTVFFMAALLVGLTVIGAPPA